ncbi:hypothetical protein FKP32DRAFT_1125804 [Trametes sanguinea]|nr:hypothetical protein FKP32DRAFT_1125804 [Trametes sanguinea]
MASLCQDPWYHVLCCFLWSWVTVSIPYVMMVWWIYAPRIQCSGSARPRPASHTVVDISPTSLSPAPSSNNLCTDKTPKAIFMMRGVEKNDRMLRTPS